MTILPSFYALAQEQEQNPDSEPASWPTTLIFKVPFVLKHFETLPNGVSESDVSPPYELGFEMTRERFFLEIEAAFTRHGILPPLGINGGLRFNPANFELKPGLLLTTQALLSKDEASLFVANRIGLTFDSTLHLGGLDLGLGLAYMFPFSVKYGNFEDLETVVKLPQYAAFKPRVDLDLFLGFKTRAEIGIYYFDKTAIASKEFGFAIDDITLTRLELSLGLEVLNLEFWLKGTRVWGVTDSTEQIFRAPYYTHDYLMAPETLIGEVKWNI